MGREWWFGLGTRETYGDYVEVYFYVYALNLLSSMDEICIQAVSTLALMPPFFLAIGTLVNVVQPLKLTMCFTSFGDSSAATQACYVLRLVTAVSPSSISPLHSPYSTWHMQACILYVLAACHAVGITRITYLVHTRYMYHELLRSPILTTGAWVDGLLFAQ